MLIFTFWAHFRRTCVDLKVNKCWPNFKNFERMVKSKVTSIYSFQNGLELDISHIYMKNVQILSTCPKTDPPTKLLASYIYFISIERYSKNVILMSKMTVFGHFFVFNCPSIYWAWYNTGLYVVSCGKLTAAHSFFHF